MNQLIKYNPNTIYNTISSMSRSGMSSISSMSKTIYRNIYNTLFVSANLIIPHIWLGNIYAAHDYDFIIQNNIDIIINCTADYPFISHDNLKSSNVDNILIDNLSNRKISLIRIPVYDSLLEKDIILMEQYFKIIIPYICHAYTNKKNILIHCYAGKQRSAIVVAAFLYAMYLQGLPGFQGVNFDFSNYKKVFKYIVNKRPQAFTYGMKINFLRTFKRFFNL